jgi:hypothetical protein
MCVCYVCECVYIYIYICMYVCIYIYVHIRVHNTDSCVGTQIHTDSYTRTHRLRSRQILVHKYSRYLHTNIQTQKQAQIHADTFTRTYRLRSRHKYTQIPSHEHTDSEAGTNTNIYTHTHTHTYIQIHSQHSPACVRS